MTFWTLIRRGLTFHARAHLGVVLGAAVGSAALIGALVVGDSVRESLKDMALARLGRVETAMAITAKPDNSILVTNFHCKPAGKSRASLSLARYKHSSREVFWRP